MLHPTGPAESRSSVWKENEGKKEKAASYVEARDETDKELGSKLPREDKMDTGKLLLKICLHTHLLYHL